MAHAEPVSGNHKAPGSSKTLWTALALLVAVPLAVFLLLAPSQNDAAADVQTFTTNAGEERSLRLDDGSQVRLNEDSTVSIRYSDQQRRVQLTHGSATVVVAPDAVRPFWAQAGNLRLRADVSAFHLRLNEESVVLQVIEGSVRAQSAGSVQTLNSGDQIMLALQR
ncbi:FecR family protein [Thalassolituus sp. LLYu03]|uniref:FecR family protein n=1 Tax=Thalassolituus sp. LLYu03 TaxID=3421656 RepID=UPI003D2BE099